MEKKTENYQDGRVITVTKKLTRRRVDF